MKALLTAAFLLLTAGLQAGVSTKLKVFVPVLPYETLFERIGGDWIEVRAIVQEGGDCHNYSPTPRQVADIARSNLLVSGGLSFESNFYVAVGDGENGPKEFDLLEGLELLEGTCSECASASAEGREAPAHQHEHEEKDAHVWLSPKVLRHQAGRVATLLKANLPAAAGPAIDANLASFTADLDAVDAELKKTLAPKKGRAFYVYHGAFAYFALDYGLQQKAIEVGNRKPSPKQVAAIAKQAKEEGVTTIFVQPQFDQSSATSLAETIGGKVQTLDPLEKDVLANLRVIARTIASAP